MDRQERRRAALSASRGFTYTWDAQEANPTARGKPSYRSAGVKINGTPLDPAGSYRVTVDAFLADGGDGLTALRQGTDKTPSVVDLAALNDYIATHSPLAPPPLDRIVLVALNQVGLRVACARFVARPR